MILLFTNVFYIMNQERGKGFQYTESGNLLNSELYTDDLDG